MKLPTPFFVVSVATFAAAALVASSASAQQAVQWRVEDGGNGHWYARNPAALTWEQAAAAASTRGGYVATTTTAAELAFVRTQLLLDGSTCWLGGSIDCSEATRCCEGCVWRWVTGEPFDMSWNGWVGDNAFTTERLVTDGLGFDDMCSPCNVQDFRPPSIIEWSADCNNDGIADYGQCLDGTLPDYNGNNIPDCCEAAAPCVPNMISNGSFELGPVQTCGWICVAPGDNRLVGWEVVLNSVDRERTEPAGCNENWFASHGNYSVDMNGCSVGGVIRQFVPAVVGVRYDLSFDLSLNPTKVAVGRLRASAGDTSVVFEYERRPTNPQPNEHCSMQFTALSSVTEVAFESLNQEYPAQWCGPVIDSVRLVLVVLALPTCVDADIFRDFNVNGADLGILLSQWGPNTPLTRSDLNRDGVVDGADLGVFLAFWGSCPN